MIVRIILYRLNHLNPKAIHSVKYLFDQTLAQIPQVAEARIFKADSLRMNGTQFVGYDLAVMLTFNSQADLDAYTSHPCHISWMRTLLHGLVVRNSHSQNKQQELVDHLLARKSKEEIVTDPSVPPSEILWKSEDVLEITTSK